MAGAISRRSGSAHSCRSTLMTLSRITLRLARNPGTEFAGGDDRRGYVIVAPLDSKGFLDEAAWKAGKESCTVRHF
jgi:hypothetical protein